MDHFNFHSFKLKSKMETTPVLVAVRGVLSADEVEYVVFVRNQSVNARVIEEYAVCQNVPASKII